jgi:hypothetical protein
MIIEFEDDKRKYYKSIDEVPYDTWFTIKTQPDCVYCKPGDINGQMEGIGVFEIADIDGGVSTDLVPLDLFTETEYFPVKLKKMVFEKQ